MKPAIITMIISIMLYGCVNTTKEISMNTAIARREFIKRSFASAGVAAVGSTASGRVKSDVPSYLKEVGRRLRKA